MSDHHHHHHRADGRISIQPEDVVLKVDFIFYDNQSLLNSSDESIVFKLKSNDKAINTGIQLKYTPVVYC